MGITSSIPVNNEEHIENNLNQEVDNIAINYIFTQNTIDLIRLSDKDYYDNMIILTSGIIRKRLTPIQLSYLHERVMNGMNEDLYFQNSKNMRNMIPKNDKLKDKLLRNISKFYMKIITIYSAIVSTMDPQYFYEEKDGTTKTFYLRDFKDYKDIPHDAKPRVSQFTNPLNLCRKRLSILKNNLLIEENSVTIHPGELLCTREDKTLDDEIGISELDSLYNDIYDEEHKKWKGKSEYMEKKYNKDLTTFYQIFTGNKDKPENIKSFRDIELLDFKLLNYCKKDSFVQKITLSKDDENVQEYLDKIKDIHEHIESMKEKFLSILRKLFISSEINNKLSYQLNPELNLNSIIGIESDTREAILKMYSTCEKLFVQALIIFEKIYKSQDHVINEERNTQLNESKIIPPTNEIVQENNEKPSFLSSLMNNFKSNETPIESPI